MKIKAKTAIFLSGFLWFAIGFMLLYKGLFYLADVGKQSEQMALYLVAIGLFLGFIKGRIVLKKTVNRIVSRIASFQGGVPLKQLYPKKYFILLGSMMLMGVLFRVLPIRTDVRGVIDVAIGSGLINGALLYFREAVAFRYL